MRRRHLVPRLPLAAVAEKNRRLLAAALALSWLPSTTADADFRIASGLIDAEAVVGREVRDLSGQAAGRIRAIVVDPRGGRLANVIVARNGSWKLPWEALDLTSDPPRVRWSAAAPVGHGPSAWSVPAEGGHRERPLHELVGMALQTPEGENLGNLERLIATEEEGRLVYGVVEFGGLLGLSENVALVPWRAFESDPWWNFLEIEIDEETLRASAVEEEKLGELTALDSARELHDRFDLRPYWEVYGTLPARALRGDPVPLREHWEAGREVSLRTVLTGVGTYYPDRGPSLVRLRLAPTADPRIALVAPWWFCRERGVEFRIGDTVEIRGVPVTLDGRPVLLARSVAISGRPFVVRDENGLPGWVDETASNAPGSR